MTIQTLAEGLILPFVLFGSIVVFDWLLMTGIDPGLAVFGITVANLSGSIRLKSAGVLELKGCALAIFCQRQTWRRPVDLVEQVTR
jgi:hypothetical protein